LHRYSLTLKLRRIWQWRMDFSVLLNIGLQWNNNDHLHTWLVQSRQNSTWYPNLDDHHQSFGSWSIARFNVSWPGLAEPNSRSACISTGKCLKFCDIIICCNTPHWIIHRNYVQTVWQSVIQFNELGHMGSQVSDSVAWTVCRCRRSVTLKREVVIR